MKKAEDSAAKEYSVEELFLLHLRYKESRLVQAGGNRPILLNNPHTSWVVYRGSADVFAVSLRDGKLDGARTHLFSIHAGDAAFGAAPDTDIDIGLIMVGRGATLLLQIDSHRLHALARDDEFSEQITGLVNRWVRNLTNRLLDELPPKACIPVKHGGSLPMQSGQSVCAHRNVLWARHNVGRSRFAQYDQLPLLNGKLRWPLSERGWIESVEKSELDLIETQNLLQESPSWTDLAYFQNYILLGLQHRLTIDASSEIERMRQKTARDSVVIDFALRQIVRPFETIGANNQLEISDEPLVAVMQLAGRKINVDIAKPPPTVEPTIENIARHSQCQIRKVALRGEWWRQDNGDLVGFLEEGRQPVALLKQGGNYFIYDPNTSQGERVTAETAVSLQMFAYMIYRPFPSEEITLWKLLRFGFQGSRADYQRIILMGSLSGLIGLLSPIATGILFDQIIPSGNTQTLWQIGLALLMSLVAMTLFQIVQNLSMLRLQTKMGAELQASVWDRVLSLPAPFFRNYSAGDLGTRVMGISQIQQMLSGTIMGVILASIFSIFSYILLFIYHVQLALIATGLVAVAVGATVYLGYKQIALQRIFIEIQGQLSSVVLQAIQGIAKFRAAGAEGKAFAEWGKEFGRYKTVNFEARSAANKLEVFNSGYQIVTMMVIFAAMAHMTQQTLTTGEFLAFNTAFLQFFGGMLGLSAALISILNIVPLYERAMPILTTLPEVDALKKNPGSLKGAIAARHITFRYKSGGDAVLNDVSIEANPGEFIALVGPSGSGKSTLFRILLGFEQPESGAVYYDNQLLSTIDVREVRRQLGVVLQNGQVPAGDVFSSIVGTANLTLEDAWQAAEMAGLANDIREMPMGMHTVLNLGGGALSGGQRQRLLIARAIVNRPRILFFDEATSALDNHTQAVVSQSLEDLQATRVVIAHRLSTIKNADKIFVLQDGRIAQQGTYEELINADGLFADLAKRQIA